MCLLWLKKGKYHIIQIFIIKKYKRNIDHTEDKNIPSAKNKINSNAYHSEDLKNYSTNEDAFNTPNPLDFYDFEGHSMKIFKILNKLRRHPEKFIKKLNYIISKIDRDTNTADLEKYNAKVTLDVQQPMDAIAFLEKVSPKNSLLWSVKYNIRAFEELEISVIPNVKYSTNALVDLKHDLITKIKTNFVYSPKLTVLLIFLMSEENRKIIFSDDVSVASVATLCYEGKNIIETFTEKGNTLIYFVKCEAHWMDYFLYIIVYLLFLYSDKILWKMYEIIWT